MISIARFGNTVFLVVLIFWFAVAIPGESENENVKKLAVANNLLALKLHQHLSADSVQNIFFSPISLSVAFAMLLYGAKGDTAKELKKVLGYEQAGLSDEQIHSSFKIFLEGYIPSEGSEESNYTLDVANLILADKNLQLIPKYKSEVQNFYQAPINDINFKDGPNLIKKVNKWVQEKTRGKIDKLLDNLKPSSAMMVLNAIYFKGPWKIEFDRSITQPQDFYNNGSESGAKKVPMMHVKGVYPHTEIEDLQILEMPYKGENVSMFIFLPKARDGLDDLEKRLTLKEIDSLLQRLTATTLSVTLPQFKIEYSKELSSSFQALGVDKAFKPGKANFSGMSPSKDIYVGGIVHKAIIEVSEEGSEVAASTGIVLPRSLFPEERNFTVDHPFLFTIIEKQSSMALFVGRVYQL